MNWFAVYTNPRAEKKAYADIVGKGIQAYLPLQRTLRQWSDRKKWVEEPLFKSYIFVHISDHEYFEVLNTPGVVRYVTFEGRAVAIPEKQIEAIRYFLSTEDQPVEWTTQLIPGQKVEVIKGPLHGLCGELVEISGKHKVKVEIDALGQFLNLTISQGNLRVIK